MTMITYSTDIDRTELLAASILVEPRRGISLDTLRDSMYPTITLTAATENTAQEAVKYISKGLGRDIKAIELYRKS